jgi:hypothetical protein
MASRCRTEQHGSEGQSGADHYNFRKKLSRISGTRRQAAQRVQRADIDPRTTGGEESARRDQLSWRTALVCFLQCCVTHSTFCRGGQGVRGHQRLVALASPHAAHAGGRKSGEASAALGASIGIAGGEARTIIGCQYRLALPAMSVLCDEQSDEVNGKNTCKDFTLTVRVKRRLYVREHIRSGRGAAIKTSTPAVWCPATNPRTTTSRSGFERPTRSEGRDGKPLPWCR